MCMDNGPILKLCVVSGETQNLRISSQSYDCRLQLEDSYEDRWHHLYTCAGVACRTWDWNVVLASEKG